MIKLFTSIIISIIISLLGSNILTKNIKQRWELNLNYEHISRSLNVEYEIVMDIAGNKYNQNFIRYIDLLNTNISTPGRLNPCSKIRSTSSTPNVLLKYDKAAVEIIIKHEDTKMIERCENFIDNQIKDFTAKKKELLKKIVNVKQFNNSNTSGSRYDNEKIANLLKQILLNAENKDSLSYQDIQSLTTSMMLLDFMSPKRSFINTDKIDEFKIVTKSYRYMSQEKINSNVLFISLFIISFSILLIIINFRRLKSRKTAFKKILKSIIN